MSNQDHDGDRDAQPQIELLNVSRKTDIGSPRASPRRRRYGSSLSIHSGGAQQVIETLNDSYGRRRYGSSLSIHSGGAQQVEALNDTPRSQSYKKKRQSGFSVQSAPNKPSDVSKRSTYDFQAGRSIVNRLRAQTVVGASSRVANASINTVNSVRGVTNAVGIMVVPSFKTSWKAEIEEAGRRRSIVAFMVSMLTTVGLNALLLLTFSKLDPYCGLADKVFNQLSDNQDEAFPLLIVGACGLFSFHVLDFHYSVNKSIKALGFLIIIGSIALIITGTLFLTVERVAAPILLWFFLVPVILLIIKRYLFHNVNNRWYMLGSAIGLIITTVCSITLFLVWYFLENKRFTDDIIEAEFWNITSCAFDQEIFDLNQTFVVDGEIVVCPQAFIIYVLPVVLGVYSFIFANILTFTFRAEERKKAHTLKKPIEPIAQIFLITTVLGIVATWIVASLFAAEIAEVSSEVLYLSLIALATIALIIASVFNVMKIKSTLAQTPLGVKVLELSQSEWVDAVVVFIGLPVVAGYLLLSSITQTIRRFSPLGKTLVEEDEKDWWFTRESQWAITRIRAWDLGSLLTKVLNLGILWFLFVIIIGRLVNVILSELLVFLEEQGFGLLPTTAVFLLTGLGLFMLPPVPGLPIYLCGGIILSQSAQNEGFSIGEAGAYAVLISSVVKMLAIVIQHKFIGQMLAQRSVAVRSAVQINSLELRAMRKIMSVPGLSVPKVAVLVGGPDWPTVVLTGILGLPLCQMLLGSIPVLITIIPVCYAGAVLVEGDESPLAPLNAVLLSISVVVQLTPFFIAIHYIAKAAIDYAKELDDESLDQEVLEYEKKNQEKKGWKILLTKWKNFSKFGKICHVFFAGLMIISNNLFTFLGDLNFESFEITDTVDEQLDGNVFNLLKPLGYFSLSLFGLAFIYLIIFGRVQSVRVSRALAASKVLPREELPELEEAGFASLKGYSQRYFAVTNNNDNGDLGAGNFIYTNTNENVRVARTAGSGGPGFRNTKISHRQRQTQARDDIEQVI